jgi:hypothetical protein
MSARWPSVLLLLAILTSAGSVALAGPLKLRSGKSVEVLAVGPLQSTHGWIALMLKYRTLIPFSDGPTLREEVDEIWDLFVVDAERGGYASAIISANDAEKGFVVTTNNSYNFVFEKRDGSWRTLESKERTQAKLDEAFVREFMHRIDSAFEHDTMNALLLYMSNDWAITITKPNDPMSAAQTLDRMKFATVSHSTFAAASDRRHTREITNISVTDGGARAQVTSRETEEITIKDRRVSDVERSIDSFELHGDVMLWTKSVSVIERQTDTKAD